MTTMVAPKMPPANKQTNKGNDARGSPDEQA